MISRIVFFTSMLLFAITTLVAQVSFTNRPSSMQLYPRCANDSAKVNIAGSVNVTGYTKVIFTMHKNNVLGDSTVMTLAYRSGKAAVTRTYSIHAERSVFRFTMYLYNGSAMQVFNADSVCSGDVYLICGQSNAVAMAKSVVSDTASLWVRSFGSNTAVKADCEKDTAWGLANAGTGTDHCGIGVWGYRFAKYIADSIGIPVCVINGAKNGSTIAQNIPLADHADRNAIYGKYLYRTLKAKVTGSVKGILWYQGESDADSGYLTYASYFNELYTAWQQDFPQLSKIIIIQTRPGCIVGPNMIYHQHMREVLRTLQNKYNDVMLMTTTAIPTFDGCHFSVSGYDKLGQQLYGLLSVLTYNGISMNTKPPMLLQCTYSDSTNTVINLVFDQPVTVPSTYNGYDVRDYIYLNSSVTVTNIVADGVILQLQLSASSNANKISYLPGIYYNGTSSVYQGPWLVNSSAIGVPTFNEVPVVNTLIIKGSLCDSGTVLLSTNRVGQTYQWLLNGTAITNANTSQLNATSAGAYTLLMKDADSIAFTSNAIKLLNGKIVPVISSPTGQFTYCLGQSISLTTTTATTYEWLKSGIPMAGATADTYPVSTNGSYSVRVQNQNGCSATSAAVNVTTASSSSATFTLANQYDVCQDSMVALTANTASGYTYQWQKNSLNIPGATTRNFNTIRKGSYRVIVTNGIGCSKTSSAKTIPLPNPVAAITAPASTICPGNIVTLSANTGTGYTYKWFKNTAIIAGAIQQTYDATTSGSYGVRITNSMGCLTNSPAKVIAGAINCIARMSSATETSNNRIVVFPNPFTSSFSAYFAEPVASTLYDFELMNAEMKKVVEIKDMTIGAERNLDVNVGHLASGMYFYRIFNADEQFTGKLIKD